MKKKLKVLLIGKSEVLNRFWATYTKSMTVASHSGSSIKSVEASINPQTSLSIYCLPNFTKAEDPTETDVILVGEIDIGIVVHDSRDEPYILNCRTALTGSFGIVTRESVSKPKDMFLILPLSEASSGRPMVPTIPSPRSLINPDDFGEVEGLLNTILKEHIDRELSNELIRDIGNYIGDRSNNSNNYYYGFFSWLMGGVERASKISAARLLYDAVGEGRRLPVSELTQHRAALNQGKLGALYQRSLALPEKETVVPAPGAAAAGTGL